jgi:hypothetical protein
MGEVFLGTAELRKGVDAALQEALSEADKKKPPKVGALGYQYEVKSIRGKQGGIDGDTLTVEIETIF